MNKIILDDFQKIINENNKFLLTTHVNPDGDAVGSTMALYHHLKNKNKEVQILSHTEVPKYYKFLDPDNAIKIFSTDDASKLLEADVIIVLDLNDLTRVRSLAKYISESKSLKVIIDHHLPAERIADIEFSDENASSTGEILYRLLSQNGKHTLSKPISTALYTAIMTDTLSFHLPKMTSDVYRIIANLVDWGANPTDIYYNVYEKNDISRFLLLGEILSDAQILHNGKLIYIKVNQEQFKKTNTSEPDIDNFIDYGLKIDKVQIAIFFVELKDGVKISFRSRGNIPVNELAKIYGGNGHRNAAGARLFKLTLDEIIPKVLESAKAFV